jgi:hypothetical protein
MEEIKINTENVYSELGTTNRTVRNIKKSLFFSLKEKYGFEGKEQTHELLKIHGLDDAKFDFVNFVNTLINGNLSDTSIDSNSNKNEKTIEGVQQEAIAPVKKLVGYDYLYRKMKELYGKKEAKRLSGEMYDLSLGLADSISVLRPYCFALDASKLVTVGRPFGQLHSKPCKRVDSYIASLCETIHQMSNHCSGALAIGSLFLDIAHLLLFKEKVDLRDLKTNKKIRKRLENEFQSLVHSVNHLSRSTSESSFTNVSIFDRIKLRMFIQEMSWYFPYEELPIDKPNIEKEEDLNLFYENYIIDYIIELQNIFLDFFDKGDPTKNGAPIRFPILTLNISKTIKEGKETIDDLKFLRDVCKREIYRYNIFTSEGTKICSCCRLVNNIDMLQYAAQSNSFGAGSSISLGSHRVCTINFMRIALEAETKENIKEEFFILLEKRIESTIKILNAHRELLKDLIAKNLQPFFGYGWLNLNRMFSTIGIIGIYEAAKLLKEKDIGGDIESEILIFLNEKVKALQEYYNASEEKEYFINGINYPEHKFLLIKNVNSNKIKFIQITKIKEYDTSAWEVFQE